MQEIEVKIPDIDVKEIVSRLEALGAKKTFEGVVDALFFDYAKPALQKQSCVLRLRRMGKKCFLTFKSPVSMKHAKTTRFPLIFDKCLANVNCLIICS